MSDITISYKGSSIATMDATGTKTLLTEGKYCEDDIEVAYVKPSGGDDTLEKMLTNTLTDYSSDVVTNIHTSAFNGCTNLETVSFPNVTSLGTYAFSGCTKLRSASLPNVKQIENYVFNNCSNLEAFDFSEITTINGASAFYNNIKLVGVYAPKATIGAFGSLQFGGCTALLFSRAPNHPSSSVIRAQCYQGCTSLKLVDCGSASSFSVGENFKGCTSLEVIILRRTVGITALGNTNNFSGVSQNVKVYVPSALKSTYESATNWSTLVSNGIVSFYNLENSAYEEKDFTYMGVPA